MSNVIQIKGGKKRIRSFGGVVKKILSAVNAICCCSKGGIAIPPTCGNNATCNSPCTGRAKYNRGEACPCPCDGRTDFPPDYDWTWTTTVKTSVKLPDAGTPPDYWEIVGPSTYSKGRCDGFGTVDYVVNHYASDGVTFVGTGQASLGFNGRATFTNGDCNPDHPDLNKIYVSGAIQLQGNLPNELTGPVAGGFFYFGSVSRCKGGTIATPVDGSLPAFPMQGNSPFGNGTGTIAIKPACRDCDGVLFTDGADPPAFCGLTYVVGANVNDGPLDGGGNPTSQLHVYTLVKTGVATWLGVDQFGNAADITPLPSDPSDPTLKCCPTNEDCGSPGTCDGSAGPLGFQCNACWRLQLTASGSFVFYFGNGSCPNSWIPDAYAAAGPYTFDLNSYGFTGDCPPGTPGT